MRDTRISPQFRSGITMQRSIRHHHTTPAQQRMHLRQSEIVIQPCPDLVVVGSVVADVGHDLGPDLWLVA